MSALASWLGHPMVESLGWTLIHFLWQGAFIMGLLAVSRAVLRWRTAESRYLSGCAALLLMAAAPMLTFTHLNSSLGAPLITRQNLPRRPIDSTELDLTVIHAHWTQFLPSTEASPWIALVLRAGVCLWFVGMTILAARLLGGLWRVQRLRARHVQPLGEPWQGMIERLRSRMEIARPVRLLKSALIEVPTVIGWLRPVILLPASLLMGMTPAQVESILAHELAHIKRHDYLVNLFQCVLETLLFYHPAVWWVSNEVRQERECCCDELAARECGDRVEYARALAALDQLRPCPAPFALSASGGFLLNRVRRLLGLSDEKSPQPRRRFWIFLALAGGVCMVLLLANPAFAPRLYKATARIDISKSVQGERDLPGYAVDRAYDPYFIQTHLEKIRSKTVLTPVMQHFRLAESFAKQSGRPKPLTQAETYAALMKRVRVRQLRNTTLIAIEVRDQEPSQAAAIANALAESYAQSRLTPRDASQRRGVTALAARLDQQKRELLEREDNLGELRKELAFVSLDENSDVRQESEARRRALEEEKAGIEKQSMHFQSLLHQLLRIPVDHRANSMPWSLNSDKILESLLVEMNSTERQLTSAKVDLGDQHPKCWLWRERANRLANKSTGVSKAS